MVPRSLLLGLTFALAVAGSARAQVSFVDNFNDGYLDPTAWTPSSATYLWITEEGGVLTINNWTAGAGTLTSVYAFEGDFDVQVDFDLLAFPAIWLVEGGLTVKLLDQTPRNEVSLYRRRTSSDNVYRLHELVNGSQTILTEADTGVTAGTLRIVRQGSQFTAYYWSGGWQVLGSTSHFTGPAIVDLFTRTAVNYPPVTVAFDDFQMLAESMTPNCNGNDVADVVEMAACPGVPWCDDCNGNGLLDECDLANGLSFDNDGNGIPDECEVEYVPTVSEWGLIAMALLLLVSGAMLLRRPQTAD